MDALSLRTARDLRAPLDEMIAEHGLLSVGFALMRAALRRGKSRPPPITGFSDHMLRDIGIEPGPRRGPYDWNRL